MSAERDKDESMKTFLDAGANMNLQNKVSINSKMICYHANCNNICSYCIPVVMVVTVLLI